MSHRIYQDLYVALTNNVCQVPDPGASGTIGVGTKSLAICEVVTATTESRTLTDASDLPVGTRCIVCLKTDGGDLTIASDDTSVVLADAGDVAEFVVSKSGTDNVWKCNLNGANLPVDNGAYALASTNTAADNALAILQLVTALQSAGVVSTVWTQA